MAEVKAYACDICGLLTRHSYDHFDFDKQMYGKKYNCRLPKKEDL